MGAIVVKLRHNGRVWKAQIWKRHVPHGTFVVPSDGTGNSAAKANETNVWRLFQALDQTRSDQIVRYDDGVGTSSNKYLAAFGGAFGWG